MFAVPRKRQGQCWWHFLICRCVQKSLKRACGPTVNQRTVVTDSTLAAAGGHMAHLESSPTQSFAGKALACFSRMFQTWMGLHIGTVLAVNSLYFTVVLSPTGLENLTRKAREWCYGRKVGASRKKKEKERRRERGRAGREPDGVRGEWRRKERKREERSRQVRKEEWERRRQPCWSLTLAGAHGGPDSFSVKSRD